MHSAIKRKLTPIMLQLAPDFWYHMECEKYITKIYQIWLRGVIQGSRNGI